MKPRPHRFSGKVCHWFYCIHCGLIALKNEPTRASMARPCPGYE